MRERPRTDMLRRRAGEQGFSLTELLLVVALIGLIALAAVPAFGSFARSWKARSTADDMLAVIRSVRQMAISTRQDLTITFTPGKPGSYTYYHPIDGTTRTVTLPDQIKVVTNPSGSYAAQFRTNGGMTPSSTPSMKNPTANFVRLEAVINTSRTDLYTFGFSAAGMATYTVTR